MPDYNWLNTLDKNNKLRLEMLLKLRDRRVFFAKEHHINDHGEPMDFDSSPGIRSLYNSISPDISVMGSAQSMKTEWMIVDHFAAASLGLHLFYVLPKYDSRNTFVQNRIDKVILDVPYYRQLAKSGFFDSISMKHFGSGVIKYVGSNVAADFKEFPADAKYIDEKDRCDRQQIKEADARMGASKYHFNRQLGNPEQFGEGIHADFLAGDQHVRYVVCEKCGKHSHLDWFKTVVSTITDKNGEIVKYVLRDKEWTPRARRDIFCICPKCGGPLLRFAPEGKWEKHSPDSRKESWHFTKLGNNPTQYVTQLWENFLDAQNDPTKMQLFWMNDLGLPYQNAEASIGRHILDNCAQLEPFVLKENAGHLAGDRYAGPCSAGIDVNGSVYDLRISDISERQVRKAVYIGKLRDIEEVKAVCLRYNVKIAVIDSEPEIHIAEQFQENAPFVVWRCKYPPGEGRDTRLRKDYENMRITIDRTVALDRALSAIRSGLNLLPSNYAAILGGQYLSEMTYSVRRAITDGSGNKRNIWTKGDDHARHADFYDYQASALYEPMVISSAYVV